MNHRVDQHEGSTTVPRINKVYVYIKPGTVYSGPFGSQAFKAFPLFVQQLHELDSDVIAKIYSSAVFPMTRQGTARAGEAEQGLGVMTGAVQLPYASQQFGPAALAKVAHLPLREVM